MGSSTYFKKALFWFTSVLVLSSATVSIAAQQKNLGKTIINNSKNNQGLCTILGVDTDSAKLACELAGTGNVLVHCLALDDEIMKQVQNMISEKQLDGLVTVEKLPLNPLPYRDNLVNTLVVADLTQAEKAGFSKEEAMRVLAPFGKLYTINDSKVDIVEKSVQKGMDEWTHNMHGPDGNRASKDTVVAYPFAFRWHGGLPFNINNRKRQGNRYSSTRGMAVANGRVFAFSDSVIENLKPAYFLGQDMDQYLTARDAFSGLLLWRKKIGKVYYGGLWHLNLAPFAAVGEFVYTVSETGKLLMIDAKTGKTVKVLDTKYAPGRLLVDDGVLVTANWKDGTSIGESKVNRYERIRMHSGIAEGNVEAYDAVTGKKIWERNGIVTSLRSADGRVYMIQRQGADMLEEKRRYQPKPKKGEAKPEKTEKPKVYDRPEQAVVALDLKTGNELWQLSAEKLAPKTFKQDHLRVECAGLNDVAIVHATTSRAREVSILSGQDGKIIMQKKTGELPLFFDGAIHFLGSSFDPATGKRIKGGSRKRVSSTICTPSFYVNDMTVRNRMGSFSINGKGVNYGGARGSCGLGSAPAFGAFYTPQNWCTCAPSQISGFICFGPIKSVPTVEEMKKTPVVEKGEAFNKAIKKSAAESTWPMCRGGEFRNSSTPVNASDKLDMIWQTKIPTPKTDKGIAFNWKELLNNPLTGPTIGNGVVTVGVMDANQVVGINLDTGSIQWRYSIGARVDSAPTIYNGICLFGAHDGYVYALDAESGALKWKLRMAPNNERMVSYGKVESPWPVIGSVLVADGVAYASAGRSQGSDGGIIVRAFSPETGAVKWSTVIGSIRDFRVMRRNDILVKTNGMLQIALTRLNPETGEIIENPTLATHKYHGRIVSLKRNIKRWQASVDSGKASDYIKKRLVNDEKMLKEAEEKGAPESEKAFALGAGSTGSEGLLNWNWPRLGDRKYRQMNYGNLGGELLSWDDKSICRTYRDCSLTCYSMDSVGKAKEKPALKANWSKSLPWGYQVTSMVLCKNAVVVSGGIYTKDSNDGKGFVTVFSRDKGDKIAEHTFPAAVAYDGLAVINNKICVSLDDSSVCLLGKK